MRIVTKGDPGWVGGQASLTVESNVEWVSRSTCGVDTLVLGVRFDTIVRNIDERLWFLRSH